ncbi:MULTISPECIES: glutathione peroxidase [unclassified Lactococcus]|uniref:glutathione peroxidase n=1 Tax=unclassified Lactococcus TaxID=2643510 RepID=UPI0011C90452|nr:MULTISPECIES: glutathione peroxidase [unclassified Lactococcus]MQW23874.1 redoxin domain-containing protein [Lactococcus sp. dk101]TXK37196.1 glutathione peroxidase [Lactococcus sp. dk310]TXK48121.1 glutathione peroxidase [Lactococcus sp. dk322]
MGFYDFEATKMNGQTVSMRDYEGKVVLVVNTASKCGFTPQFEGLETLYKTYKDQGLEILGFPCNQFAGQDAGSNSEISEFCQVNYGVTFTMFEKIKVNGKEAHPLYKYLKNEAKSSLGSTIKWNFTKFLIGRDGTVVKRFASATEPKDMVSDLELELNK